MVKILTLVAVILLLVTAVGTVCYKLGSEKQTVYSSQVSLPQNGTPRPETPNSLESLSAPPGIDPISGRPVISATSSQKETSPSPNPQNFGSPPPQESYPEMSSDYPYLAKLPAGAKGKIQVAYNYVVDYPGRYRVNLQVTNLSNQPLKGFYYNEFLKDSGSYVLNEVRDEGHHNAPPLFPILPGNSVVLETSKVALSGSFGSSLAETWKVEIEVTYLKLN